MRRPRKKRPEQRTGREAELAALDATDWDAVKAEADALRQRMGGMGAVNLVAIEEYSELKQRHDFMRDQSDDLTAPGSSSSRRSTRSTRPRRGSSR